MLCEGRGKEVTDESGEDSSIEDAAYSKRSPSIPVGSVEPPDRPSTSNKKVKYGRTRDD